MLSTLSIKVLDTTAMNGIRDINNNQLPLHNFSWVEPNLQIALQNNIYVF